MKMSPAPAPPGVRPMVNVVAAVFVATAVGVAVNESNCGLPPENVTLIVRFWTMRPYTMSVAASLFIRFAVGIVGSGGYSESSWSDSELKSAKPGRYGVVIGGDVRGFPSKVL